MCITSQDLFEPSLTDILLLLFRPVLRGYRWRVVYNEFNGKSNGKSGPEIAKCGLYVKSRKSAQHPTIPNPPWVLACLCQDELCDAQSSSLANYQF